MLEKNIPVLNISFTIAASNKMHPPLFMAYNHHRICMFHTVTPNTPDDFIKNHCTHYSAGPETPLASYYNGSHGFVYDVQIHRILQTRLLDDFPNDDIAFSVQNISGNNIL